MESKKLHTYGNAIAAATARIAHELMDPARKTAETPLEHEQREVIRQQEEALARAENCMRKAMRYMGSSPDSPVAKDLAFVREIRAAAAPYILEA